MKNRMHRLFAPDGRIFILAIDHGGSLDVLPHLNHTGNIIQQARENGVDAFITTYGIAKSFGPELGNRGVIVRVDGGPTKLGSSGGCIRQLIDIEELARLGADGAVCMGFPGAEYEETSMQNLMQCVTQSDEWNMPLCAEMLPMGWDSSQWNPERLQFVSRIAAEYGADFIKTQYTGDKESFAELVKGCYKPVIILGGPGDGSEKSLLQSIRDSLDAGGKGAAIGRSIWRHDNPAGYCRAIYRIIHEDASVEEALEEL